MKYQLYILVIILRILRKNTACTIEHSGARSSSERSDPCYMNFTAL